MHRKWVDARGSHTSTRYLVHIASVRRDTFAFLPCLSAEHRPLRAAVRQKSDFVSLLAGDVASDDSPI